MSSNGSGAYYRYLHHHPFSWRASFQPRPRQLCDPQSVTISSATAGATISYTTDGSMPTETNGTIYSGPVSVSIGTVLKAIAYESGAPDSAVTSGIYTINSPTAVVNALCNFPLDFSKPSSVVQGNDGNFYGTSTSGGSANMGAVFRITPAGVLTTLVPFSGTNGAAPKAALALGRDGNFYGTTCQGGSNDDGTVFMMTPAGVLATLVSFSGSNGASPVAGLVLGSDGNFYGTTSGGGSSSKGTVFMMTPAGVLTTLVSFAGGNGASPQTGLVQGTDGNFYGTTYAGGSSGEGTVFMMTPTGVLTSLVSFSGANGLYPLGTLVQGSDGNFYGTTVIGGSASYGTIFKMTPAGVLTPLVSFNGANGRQPEAGLVLASDGNFYGTTCMGGAAGAYGPGTIFSMTPTGLLTTLVSFDCPNGSAPMTALVQGSDGNLYGTTLYASLNGYATGSGVFFQLTIQSAAVPVFSPSPGTYSGAQTVTINSAATGATIYYTTDGSTPSKKNGTIYSGPLQITHPTLLQAITSVPGIACSPVTSGSYVVLLSAAPPVFSPAPGGYLGLQVVTITSASIGATIRYTIDGSTPSETSGLFYTGPVTISSTTMLQAIAFGAGFIDSNLTSAAYTIIVPAAAPVFSPSPTGQTVTMDSVTSGALIRYTTDGSTPTETNGTLYTGPVSITAPTTLKAVAYESGLSDSAVTSATIGIPTITIITQANSAIGP